MSLNRSSFPDLGKVFSLAGAAIKNAYGVGTASSDQVLSACRRVRFFVHIVTDGASLLTTVTVKLKMRYVSADGTVTLNYIDLPSTLDDVQGAAQPKGSTFEIEHAFATGGVGQDKVFSFYVDLPAAIPTLAIDLHANAAGTGADNVDIYAQAG